MPPRYELPEQLLWILFDHLDAQLLLGHTPENDTHLRLRLNLTALLALARTPRAPGMQLPLLVELASDLSGIDPLWGWQELHAPIEDLCQALHLLLTTLNLLNLHSAPAWPQHERQIAACIRHTAAHVFAVTRRLGLRLPDHAFFHKTFDPFGPLRALPLNTEEQATLQQQLEAITLQIVESLKTLPPEREQTPTESLEPPPLASPSSEISVEEVVVPPTPIQSPIPAHLQTARTLLKGKDVTLIGGVPDPAHHAALVQDLGLAQLDWIPVDAYTHGTHASNHIRPNTALVIIAIRWIGHAHSTLRDIARQHGVPCVMHPGGLNPSSVAWQVTQQVSRQLQQACA